MIEQKHAKTGVMIVIPVSGPIHSTPLDVPPALSILRRAVGGDIEPIPGITVYIHEGRPMGCWALCNAHGKHLGLRTNRRVTDLLTMGTDVMAGDVVILAGTHAFLRGL